MIRILIVDDHASSREPLAFLMEREDDLHVVAEASSVADAWNLLEDIDVAVVDLKLPDGPGTDVIGRLRAVNPHACALVLTGSENQMDRALALESGASAVLHKSVSIQDIVSAIRRLSAGEQIHSTTEVIELFQLASRRRRQDESAHRALETLTAREREVLQALAWGLSDKEIATHLNIGARTARSHVANILGKLQVDSRLQAVILAIRCGFVIPDQYTMPDAGAYIGHLTRDFVADSTEV